MQADAEHQEDHADLGQLVRDPLIRHVSRRERADEDPGDQVADERRDPQPLRQRAEYECEHEGHDDGRDQRMVRHQSRFLRSAGVGALIAAALRLVL